jgi:hypothetical protein
MPGDVRIDREYAIGAMLHNAYGAMESALERLIQAVDGDLPSGAAYHAELVRRAARAVNGVRPAIISRTTATELQRLRAFRHAFRHAYDGYDYARAAENVPLAERVTGRFRDEITRFATTIGLHDPGDDGAAGG